MFFTSFSSPEVEKEESNHCKPKVDKESLLSSTYVGIKERVSRC